MCEQTLYVYNVGGVVTSVCVNRHIVCLECRWCGYIGVCLNRHIVCLQCRWCGYIGVCKQAYFMFTVWCGYTDVCEQTYCTTHSQII